MEEWMSVRRDGGFLQAAGHVGWDRLECEPLLLALEWGNMDRMETLTWVYSSASIMITITEEKEKLFIKPLSNSYSIESAHVVFCEKRTEHNLPSWLEPATPCYSHCSLLVSEECKAWVCLQPVSSALFTREWGRTGLVTSYTHSSPHSTAHCLFSVTLSSLQPHPLKPHPPLCLFVCLSNMSWASLICKHDERKKL